MRITIFLSVTLAAVVLSSYVEAAHLEKRVACPDRGISIAQEKDPKQDYKVFYRDHCKGKLCVVTREAHLRDTVYSAPYCADENTICSAGFPSPVTHPVLGPDMTTVSYPLGKDICMLPPWTTSTFICPNEATVTMHSNKYTRSNFNTASSDKGTISGYFQSEIDQDGCVVTTGAGETVNLYETFYIACDKAVGTKICEKKK